MVYRLCVSTSNSEQGVEYAFAFYNQHDFCVYKRKGIGTYSSERAAYIDACAVALSYFCTHIRTRYYTEHFSELLDEDEGVVLCQDALLVDVFNAYREGSNKEKKSEYAPLYEHFDTKSLKFVLECDHALQKRTEELL